MKLLVVTHFFEGHRGGIELVAGRLARELHRLGHEVRWAAADCDRPPDGPEIEPVPLRAANIVERLTGLPMPIPSPAALLRLIREARRADAVIVHDALYLTSIAALIAGRLARRPVLLVQHIGAIPFKSRWLAGVMRVANRLVTRPMLRAADQRIFISEAVARQFAGVAGARPAMLAFNGVDTDLFAPAPADERLALRQRFGMAPGRRNVLFVGRFVEKKGLRVLQRIAAIRPDLDFALAGWGPIDPTSWGLANVRVHAGLSGAALADLYRASDLFLLPSAGEGFPLVVQEALATGLPVLCGEDSAAADLSAASLLSSASVALDAVEETAVRFARLLDGPHPGSHEERAALARTRYSWRSTAARYDGALRALVAPAKASPILAGERG